MKMKRESFFRREIVPFAALVAVECANVGQTTIYKAAVSKGLNYHVFLVYSYAISAIVLLPLACLFHRQTRLPPLSIVMLAKFFVLGFLGFAGDYIGYLGIAYSSPTLASAMSNLSPACTFFLAVVLRMEKLKLGSLSTQAKIIGTLMSICGALIVVLYNGPILITGHDEKLTTPHISTILRATSSAGSGWIVGGALLATCYSLASFWYIYQSIVIKEYPGEFILVFFYSLFAGILAAGVGFACEPDLSVWIIPSDIRLLSIFYSGIIGTGFSIMGYTWGLHVKGPVYVTLFSPLSIAIAAFLGVIFLADDLYLGSVIGSIVIVVGFYTVVWGKTKDEIVDTSNDDDLVESSATNHEIVPLLEYL